MKAILASQNTHKAEEFAASLPGIQISVSPVPVDVEENADSFIGNAQLKARGYAKQLNCNALADDSGLCVDYLNGLPGIYSARYAMLPPDIDMDSDRTAANNRKLLRALNDVPESQRTAHFCCALCLVIVEPNDLKYLYSSSIEDKSIQFYDVMDNVISKSEINTRRADIVRAEICVLGRADGHILTNLAGTGGFGYDPLFYSHEANCTFAELPQAQKMMVSHRGHAIQMLKSIVDRF